MTYRPEIGRVAGAGARRHEAGRGDWDGTLAELVPTPSTGPAGGIA